MSSCALPLQKAIYAALTGDTTLTAQATGGVYDYVNEKAVAPWVMLGDDTLRDWNTMDFHGKNVTSTIHTYSIQQGKSEAKTIMASIERILSDGVALAVSGANVVLFQLEFENVMTEPDGVTNHGVQRFRALIQEGG